MKTSQGSADARASMQASVTAKHGAYVPGLLTVLMPVYNEVATLPEALTRVLDAPVEKEVIIVDDASTDGTREFLQQQVDGHYQQVRVLYLDANGGKGTAIRAAIPHIRGEFVVIQDGDLEYDPQDYPLLLRPMMEDGAHIVYGSRFLKSRPKMRLPNRFINWLLALIVRVFFRAPITDEATCYKAFRSEVLASIPLACRRFEFCPEVTAKALRRGYRIVEVPIRYTARSKAEGKKIRWTDGITAVWTLLRYRFWRPR
ncbi:MAG: glycosyltransferase family 2 protein [Chthonomonadales bacterium]